jgi:hypothetical protein
VKGIEPFPQNPQTIENQHAPKDGEAAYTQINARILDSSCPILAKVVAAWSNLSPSLKGAILAIIGINENQKEASS